MKTIQELLVRQREIIEQLGDLATVAEKRELNAEELKNEKALNAEFNQNKRQIDLLNQQATAESNMKSEVKDDNTKLREFLRDAKPGSKFAIPVNERASMKTTDTLPHMQGVTVMDIIDSSRPDADILTAAGVPMVTGVRGNKIQWPYLGGVEAAFAGEAASTTERKADISSQSPIQQRLTVRVRLTQQAIENSDFDLRNIFVTVVRKAIRDKVNYAAASTTKATSTFYGGFAQDAESGTYGAAGYVAGKQVGTFDDFSKEVFAEMIGKIAARNIPTDNIVFVVGAADFWTMKVTPMDEGSGIMLLGPDNKVLGVPVIANNAINRTNDGTLSGSHIGLGNFACLPTLQHGDIRLSIDGSSAYAADTDEVIITINADFSMTVMNAFKDAFVVYTKN